MGEERKIEKKEEKKDNNTTVLTIIAIATLLIALVGATFAYFSAQANNNNNQSVTITTAAPVALEYNSEGAIAITDAQPGAHGEATFTVTNPELSTDGKTPNNTTYTYDLNLITMVDSFEVDNTITGGTDQLILKVTETATSTPKIGSQGLTFNLTDGANVPATQEVVKTQEIAPRETQTYTAVLDFVELESKQDSNAAKSYAGHFDIDNIKSVNNQSNGG